MRILKIIELDGGGAGRGGQRKRVRASAARDAGRHAGAGAVDGRHQTVEIVIAADSRANNLRTHYQLNLAWPTPRWTSHPHKFAMRFPYQCRCC